MIIWVFLKYPFVVLGNKWDLKDDIQVKNEDISKWWEENGNLDYIETSAKDNVGVENAFRVLIKQALKNESERKLNLPEHIKITKLSRYDDDKQNDPNRKKQKKKWC